MSDLIERIKELEEKELQLIGLRNKVYSELGGFIQAWDSGDPDALPANRQAMINDVRSVFDYVLKSTGH
ncbi:hypothetical protein VWJ25_05775 [Escherichia coli O157]|uniref:Uncharacterized protein n=1 Tax=Escherichia phage UB TaxID=2268588 RepID=A0A2Z5HAH0_9CAUD|nr:hypothetical protein [Escherichia phage UB]EFJ0710434.1 hypothetical protein [Escherichia coli]MDI1143572.1 hypothetical protein [Escherichia coli]MED6924724.1 hypothetical protein [Escherichia coli O157]